MDEINRLIDSIATYIETFGTGQLGKLKVNLAEYVKVRIDVGVDPQEIEKVLDNMLSELEALEGEEILINLGQFLTGTVFPVPNQFDNEEQLDKVMTGLDYYDEELDEDYEPEDEIDIEYESDVSDDEMSVDIGEDTLDEDFFVGDGGQDPFGSDADSEVSMSLQEFADNIADTLLEIREKDYTIQYCAECIKIFQEHGVWDQPDFDEFADVLRQLPETLKAQGMPEQFQMIMLTQSMFVYINDIQEKVLQLHEKLDSIVDALMLHKAGSTLGVLLTLIENPDYRDMDKLNTPLTDCVEKVVCADSESQAKAYFSVAEQLVNHGANPDAFNVLVDSPRDLAVNCKSRALLTLFDEITNDGNSTNGDEENSKTLESVKNTSRFK